MDYLTTLLLHLSSVHSCNLPHNVVFYHFIVSIHKSTAECSLFVEVLHHLLCSICKFQSGYHVAMFAAGFAVSWALHAWIKLLTHTVDCFQWFMSWSFAGKHTDLFSLSLSSCRSSSACVASSSWASFLMSSSFLVVFLLSLWLFVQPAVSLP